MTKVQLTTIRMKTLKGGDYRLSISSMVTAAILVIQ